MKCPICSKPAVEEYKPFCSKHCKNQDLLNWANGAYTIPAEEGFAEDVVESEEEI